MSVPIALSLAAVACGFAGEGADHEPLLKPGDRVAFVGGSFWEEERRGGEIETALTLAVPDVTFRHLGWSGDMADQSARRFFGTAQDGREHLLEHVDLVDPTVIFVAYGQAEALPGGMSVADFEANLNSLLDELEQRTGRIVLTGPFPPRASAERSPFAASKLVPYQNVVARLAQERGLPLIQTATWSTAEASRRSVKSARIGTDGISTTDRVEVTVRPRRLTPARLFLRWLHLPDGSTDGPDRGDSLEPPSSLERNAGVVGALIYTSRELAERSGGKKAAALREKLARTVRNKNDLFLQRHRPQNETYLRGFRAHEQGNNAVEIERFEPLVAAKDAEIQSLRTQIVKDQPE